MTDSILRQAAIDDINAFRERHGMGKSTFGRVICGDLKFMRNIVRGDNIGLCTLERIAQRMAAYDAAANEALDDDYDAQPWQPIRSRAVRLAGSTVSYQQAA
jgi:hypothetical protein